MTQQPNQAIIKQLRDMGFDDTVLDVPRRLVVVIGGPGKTAKTHFALTAPDPIFYINMDDGAEGVIEKFQQSGKRIYVKNVRVSRGEKQNVYEELWKGDAGVKPAILKACAVREGTIVMDTASELYELSRLSEFGKLEQVKPFHYARVNAEWQKEILAELYASKMNVVMIHRIKPKYVNDVRTGDYELSGFSDTDYKAQVVMTTFRNVERDDDDNPSVRFGYTITDCRQNAAIIGQTFTTVAPIVNDHQFHVDPVVNFDFLLNLVHGPEK
ncbi:MAG: hypothetical protein JRN35_05835 [Nitrososphaerota archaeon]|nr:hypothetical protein [Nitrososphaerota archaeon]